VSEADKLLEQYVLDNFYPEIANFARINGLGVNASGYKCNKILISGHNSYKLGCLSVYIQGKNTIEEFYPKKSSPVGVLYSKCVEIEEEAREINRLNKVRNFLKGL
jgi:hypothetical protein